MTATITRRATRPSKHDLEIWQPSDRWVDPVVVRRALAGKPLDELGLCGRRLTDAEAIAIIGPVLDGVYEATMSGYPPLQPITALTRRMRWTGTMVARLTLAARPEHAERMRKARAEYQSWEGISIGRERKHVKGAGVRSTRSAASRKAARRAFVGKTSVAA